MKIAIVGPAHPYKGGIVQHTTELAHRLAAAGHEVSLISWRTQYPFFYPGAQFVPEDQPEQPPFENTKRVLLWKDPAGWWRWGRRLRAFDRVLFVWWVPTIQGPVYLAMLRSLGKHGPQTVLICHNVTQHRAGPADRRLARAVFLRMGKIIVHTKSQAEQARALTATPVSIAALTGHLPVKPQTEGASRQLHRQLLFFGLIRPYKGVDVLIKAVAEVPGIRLTIAGEAWGKLKVQLEGLIEELGLSDRVSLLAGYVPSEDIAGLFAAADASVLPYRSGTATQNVGLAFAHGLPVIATNTGSMPGQLRDGLDGLICQPGDVASLAEAIKHFYKPGVAKKLQANIPGNTADSGWKAYIDNVTA